MNLSSKRYRPQRRLYPARGSAVYRLNGLEYRRPSRPGSALGSRQPTKCKSFCGADKLPRNSPPCCDISPQSLTGCPGASPWRPVLTKRGPGSSRPGEFSARRRPYLRFGVALPTSLLPLPTTAVLLLRKENAHPHGKLRGPALSRRTEASVHPISRWDEPSSTTAEVKAVPINRFACSP